MSNSTSSDSAALRAELDELRLRLAESEDTIAAIVKGDADAIVVRGKVVRFIEQCVVERTAELRAASVAAAEARCAALNLMEDALAARRKAEDSASALRESETRFREVVETISAVYWVTDATRHRILYLSPAFETVWGRPCASLYAAPEVWLQSVYGADRERVLRAITTAATKTRHEELTYRIVRPDGTLRWVCDRAFPVKDAAGTVIRIVGVAEDITARKELEEQFLRAQRIEGLGMLAAGIAHDLNNILAPVTMAVPLLRLNASARGDLRLLDTLEKCAERGASLVRQVLGFAHGAAGEARLVQVKHLLRDVVEVITATFPKSVVLDVEVANDLWLVTANPTHLHQVLINLCVNARDAMPDGGTLLLRAENRVLDAEAAKAIEGAMPGAYLVLQVQDTGTGMPPEVLARIWDPFFTTKPPGKGTGLGLATVRGIVATHHGVITVETEVGRGTTFHVYLPAAECGDAHENHRVHAPPPAGHGELLLLVDDEELFRDAAAAALRHAGYNVLTACNGEIAATLFRERAGEVALVITDIDMPIADGVWLTGEIRSVDPGMPVIAMSGLSSRQAFAGCRETATDFLAKPFTADSLLRVVHECLSSRVRACSAADSL